ncbi:MAG TPA: restriction endonuclease [Sulfuriferula sp.]|nr:restriction endonuclease [Sulfuriferula sp.]
MARRKRKESGLDLLIAAPWQISAILAFIILAGTRWIFPSMVEGNQVLGSFMIALKPFGYFVATVFGLIACINYFRHRKNFSSSQNVPLMHHAKSKVAFVDVNKSDDRVAKVWEESSDRPPFRQPESKPEEWSLPLLKQLEWKRFEELCAAFYREVGLRAETIRCGADGGVDAKLFRGDAAEPESIIQCKAWNFRPVGVKPVRELFGVMAHQKVGRGIFMTTSTYTKEAIEFAKENPIFLIDGEKFFSMLGKLSSGAQRKLLSVATDGDYLTPTCPSCGTKMVGRNGPKGNFWGCLNYPRCKQTFIMREIPA